jgi:hypothetical protein
MIFHFNLWLCTFNMKSSDILEICYDSLDFADVRGDFTLNWLDR